MAKIRVTQEDIEALRFKADLAYNTLKLAVETSNPWALSSAECLYRDDLGGYLSELARPATSRNFELLNKGGRRIRKIEGFILQCVLMHTSYPGKSDRYTIDIVEDPNDGMGGLKAYIDAEDDPTSPKGEVFRLIGHMSAEMRENREYPLILNAMDYVRGLPNASQNPSQ